MGMARTTVGVPILSTQVSRVVACVSMSMTLASTTRASMTRTVGYARAEWWRGHGALSGIVTPATHSLDGGTNKQTKGTRNA